MELYFPGVSIENFDFEADWVVKSMNLESKQVLFEGRGLNTDLEISIGYENSPKVFENLSLGELVQLPKELLLSVEPAPYQPISECF
ncbi:TPA: hypothetical protein VJE30_001334 [Streptococcus pyogenes]|nr:hypothetical protein [Streptococcus pyogenes]